MRIFGTAFVIALLAASPAFACNPSMINFAADDMRALGNARTVDDAQRAARRARSSVEDAEIAIMSCCPMAAHSFGDAVVNLRRIVNAMSASEIQSERGRAFRNFNDAVDNWNARIC